MPDEQSEARGRGPDSTPPTVQPEEDGVRIAKHGYSGDRLTEWLFAGMMIAWGSWLLVPLWRTFDVAQYAVLRELASENVWGAWSVAIGMVRCAALYINGSHYRTPLIRALCAFLGMFWWVTLSFLFLSTPQANPAAGFAWYPLFIVFEGICLWRAAGDAYHTRAFRNVWLTSPKAEGERG